MLRNGRRYLIISLVLIEMISLFLAMKSFSNKEINEIKETYEVDKKHFSMFINDGTGNYTEYTSSNLFPVGYKLNITKSSCIDTKGNIIEDILSGSGNNVTVTSNKTAYCYLYFDEVVDIKINVTTNGVSGLPTINKYKAELTCNDATATYSNKYLRIEFNTVTSDEVKCNLNYVNDTNIYTSLINEVESKGTQITSTNNNGNTDISYRYTGKQPNNYVWFNNELWRIIGSIPTCMDSSCTTQTNLVKIMRAESIGGLVYHSSNANTTWGSGNTLYTLLNSYYYGKQDATYSSTLTSTPCLGYSTDAYALCNYTNKGISNDSSDYYGRMVESVYMNAGTVSSTSSKIDAAYTLETATLTSSATPVGLMTSSDYGFATSGITYSSVGLSSLSSYEQNNWIYGQFYEWTMTPNSTTYVLFVYYNGNITNRAARSGDAVRPVVYLDSSVYVISGTGEESNPYILGM